MSDREVAELLKEFIFKNKELFGGDISSVTDKNGIVECLLKNKADMAQNKSEGVKIAFDTVCDIIKSEYGKYGYNKRFDRTATKKKLKSCLGAKVKEKRLYPYQVLYAFRAYLRECYIAGRDECYVKMASSFMTSMVYDYAEQTNELFEKNMEEKYGEKWRKVKFSYE